jgi:phosphoglycerate dehydrogenase-like enzyme
MHILINLPATFFNCDVLIPAWQRLSTLGEVRHRSHDTPDQIADDLAWADATIMWSWPKLDAAMLDAAGPLLFRGHLDLSQAAAAVALQRDTPVSISRGGWSPAVAEMALTLMLGCLRQTSGYHAAMRAGTERWVQQLPGDIDPRERQLTGRSVGIVGLGRIGRRLAELLQPFDVRLAVTDPHVPEAVLRDHGAQRLGIDTLCERSELLVLCAAANEGTQRLIGRQQFALMPADAVFVNVARAALVDTQALADRLRQGDLIAAVDVCDQEPLPTDSPLRGLPNLHLTPHRAGGLIESVQRVVDWLVDDLEAVLAGRDPKHALTPGMLATLDE